MTCYNCIHRAIENRESDSYCIEHKCKISCNAKACGDFDKYINYLPHQIKDPNWQEKHTIISRYSTFMSHERDRIKRLEKFYGFKIAI